MSSFRDRLMMLAMDATDRLPVVNSFKDAASICNNKETAMAFGYLMGQEDAKKEAPFSEPSIADKVVSTIEQCSDGEYDSEYAADLVFGLIYKWLDKTYANECYLPHDEEDFGTRWHLANAFQQFVKPGAINPPLLEKEA